MGGRVMPAVQRPAKVSSSIIGALASAVLEWFLIFLLFIEASFSYLVTKFARYCDLQVPCLLCSRLDHFLGKERSEFYWDLICHKHKLKISSLVLCRLHSNLVDVHGMCESCLFSFATVNKSNAETYRLLVGKLGAEPYNGLSEDPSGVGASGTVSCSCCNEQRSSRGFEPQLLQAKSIGSQGGGLDLPLPVTFGWGDLETSRDETRRAGKVCTSALSNFTPLPHVGYREVKTTSDSESENPMSEDESACSCFDKEQDKKHLAAQSMQPEPGVSPLADDPVCEKFIHPASETEPSHLDSEVKLEVTDTQFTTAPTASAGHGSGELKWKVQHKDNASATPELIYFEEEALPLTHNVGGAVDVCHETNAREEAELAIDEVKECEENYKVDGQSISTSDEQLNSKANISERTSQIPDLLELNDAYKLAIDSRAKQLTSKLSEQRSLSGKLFEQRSLSSKLLEQRSMKESSRASGDFKLLLSQLSASRGIDFPLIDMSPRVTGNMDEIRASDASSSVGIQILQKRISLERNESNISLDGSTISEIEGESVVDRLKRQVEHDKKFMGVLYKELEEERNASAIAANQAMAMITRLQEEKAALQMEALQCLRMMEEQAEYDEEALQQAMDLLAEKEKDIQDLQSKLELYAERCGPLSQFEEAVESYCRSSLGELGADDVDANHAERNTSVISNSERNKQDTCSVMNKFSKSFNDENAEGAAVEFENERSYLLQELKRLNEKLRLLCHDKVYLDAAANGDLLAEGLRKDTQQDGEMQDNQVQQGTVCDRHPITEEVSPSTYTDTEDVGKEGAKRIAAGQMGTHTDVSALRNEFALLRGRLEALETEISILEHSFNSLKNGDEGVICIQEIAHHLRDLHLSISRRC